MGSSSAQLLVLRILKEGALIAWLLVCVYLLLAFFSYSPADPHGWSSTGTNSIVKNTLGPTGAWLADRFFSFLGYAAYLFPLMIAYRLWNIFQQRHNPEPFDGMIFGLRAFSLVVLLISGLPSNGLIA